MLEVTNLMDDEAKIFTYRNEDTGLLETRSIETGELIAVQQSMETSLLQLKANKATLVQVAGKKVYLEAGLDPEVILRKKKTKKWVYSQMVGDAIAQMICEGWKVMDICKLDGF